MTHIGVTPETAWVKTTKSSACKACASHDSCEAAGKEMKVEAINSVGAREGDRIVLSFKTASLMKATFLLYVFPIICMIAGAVVGQKMAPRWGYNPSSLSAAVGFLFFFVAIFIIKIRANRMARKREYKPEIIRIM